MATESYKSFNGGVIPGGSSETSVRGKIHRIALWDVSPSDPTPRPLESWVIDLEDPNTSEPSGYSKLTVSKANEIHRNGEIFGLRVEPIQNPYDDNLLIETKFSSYSGTNLEIRLSKVSDQNVLTEYVILDYDQLAGISEHSEVRAVPDGNELRKNKFHRIGVRQVQGSDPSPKPMTDWVIDLESPNSEEPDGYDRLTVAKAKEIHANGEVFAFTSYATGGLPSNKDTYYESIFNSSSSYMNIVLTKTCNYQDPTKISRAVISDYGDYLGVTDASADSEYSNVTLVQEGGDVLKKNKIHRYSFGDGTVGGETPIYGSWLIDLDKPDPDGPEGYSRVTPAEFWQSTAVNGEVPVYLQDKNANNSLTYAYLSRTDVTKSGSTVTSVFAYFVRSGYGNELEESVGFRFTKLNGSDYLQRAASSDDYFDVRSIPRLMLYTQNAQLVDHTVTAAESSAGKISIPLSHFNRGVYLLDVQLYVGNGTLPSTHVPIYINFRYKYSAGTDTWSLKHTGALARIESSGPWYYGDTIRLLTTSSTLTGVDLEISFKASDLPSNTSIGISIDYALLSETEPS